MTMRSLRELGERQLGLVTTRDVREHLTRERARTAERRGWLVRVRPHVYRFAGARPSWHQSVLAAILVAGPDAVASHGTAAAVWRLAGFPATSATAIDITVPRGRRPQLAGLRLHQTTIGPGCHRSAVDFVPVTDVARTLCDLDGAVPVARLGRIVDDALTRKLVTIRELAETYGELRRGSRRSRAMGRVLAERGAEWDDADSPREARLVRWLTDAGLPPPVQQHAVDGYRVDLAYPVHGVFIEYDGFDPHASRTTFDHDRRRQNVLTLRAGATVLRFTSASTREEVVRDVTAALRHAAA
jgi:very-short-patch-repair endonuclease